MMATSALAVQSSFDQVSFWSALFPLPETRIAEYSETRHDDSSLRLEFSSQSNTGSANETAQEFLIEWQREQRIRSSIEASPASNDKPETFTDPRTNSGRKARKSPSNKALERRRQQNRAAQLAFRQRSKNQIEELRQELALSAEHNRKIYSTMQELLERTDRLKKEIECALASNRPLTSFNATNPTRSNSLEMQSRRGL